MAAIHSYLNRLVDLPISQARFQEELNIIYPDANMNDFNNNIIKRYFNIK